MSPRVEHTILFKIWGNQLFNCFATTQHMLGTPAQVLAGIGSKLTELFIKEPRQKIRKKNTLTSWG